MEFAVHPEIPTYTGGLGILAGDTIRAAADMGLPAVGITLLHRKGYFRQYLDFHGNQTESEYNWSPEHLMEKLELRVKIDVEGRPVHLRVWRYSIKGITGHSVPVYFLDTCLQENSPYDRELTDYLYGGDPRYRLCQEMVLGFGGIGALRALGYMDIHAYHMNEGHSAMVTLALMEEQAWGRGLLSLNQDDIVSVSKRCVFTTHTPMPAGHDEFGLDLVRSILGNDRTDFLIKTKVCSNGFLNMTNLALNYSRYVNGVSMRHEEVARKILNNHHIDAVTNGVHAVTWTSRPFCQLYDSFIPQWRRDNLYLKHAIRIPLEDIRRAHSEAKLELLQEVGRRTAIRLDPEILTIGFARRATGYKRPTLLFHNIERLKAIAERGQRIQLIYGGKAHPRDDGGKSLIRQIFEASRTLKESITVVYIEEYDINLAKYLISGVDLWLNTPQKPLEASGTSGMKAALNGIPTFSILDGWWIEGHIEGVTGWSIGDGWESLSNLESESASLYDKLEKVILPMYYDRPEEYASVMRSAISCNGSYFNAQRMVTQYLQNAYLRNLNNL
ncbi:MAG: alpha-glucan family phosphorylase [Dehalococcoidia bacterium]|nr:alpha-glucan family phosphorylase [Dehalococcoidia bacterium]